MSEQIEFSWRPLGDGWVEIRLESSDGDIWQFQMGEKALSRLAEELTNALAAVRVQKN